MTFLRKIKRCRRFKYSVSSPKGQTQLQKPLLRRTAVARAISRMINPDGCTWLNTPPTSQYFKLIRELMGKKASMPGGRVTVGLMPFSSWLTKMVNLMPIRNTVARKKYWTILRYS